MWSFMHISSVDHAPNAFMLGIVDPGMFSAPSCIADTVLKKLAITNSNDAPPDDRSASRCGAVLC